MKKQITLDAARVRMGYSLKEAAELFKVHYQTLSSWEQDSSKMKQKYVQKIPDIYHLPIEDIFFGNKNDFILVLKKEHLEVWLNNNCTEVEIDGKR